ncbi:MAG: AmmeMemoRadiSam system protein A [Firmicutes bacterium]|nr:AmmeMemoRadiSam system protein A [Bacillota bacterium]
MENTEKGIVLTGVAPHPPLLIPAVGKKQINQVTKTKKGLEELCREMASLQPEVVVVISPHGPVFQDGIVINFAPLVEGDFGDFGAPQERLEFVVDGPFAGAIQDEAEALDVPIIPLTLDIVRQYRIRLNLDHGALVPLYYLNKAGWRGKVVSVTMGLLPLDKLYAFGLAVQRAATNFGRRAVVLASGDLSHRLTPDAPSGFNPRGKEFDAAVTRALETGNVEALLSLDEELREAAGECGFRPFVMMAGAVDGRQVEPKFYSYQGPFGVGYAVASWKPGEEADSRRYLDWLINKGKEEIAKRREKEHPIVKLAREAAEKYVREGEILKKYPELPKDLPEQAGVFVSVKKHKALRGCIGTFIPTQPTLAEEVVHNAIRSVSADPRFEPVTPEELPELTYSVDVLTEPREVEDLSKHDPKVHGIIVAKDGRRGLLLPDLEGIDTTDQQIAVAKQKAGIAPDEDGVSLAEFEVTRYK